MIYSKLINRSAKRMLMPEITDRFRTPEVLRTFLTDEEYGDKWRATHSSSPQQSRMTTAGVDHYVAVVVDGTATICGEFDRRTLSPISEDIEGVPKYIYFRRDELTRFRFDYVLTCTNGDPYNRSGSISMDNVLDSQYPLITMRDRDSCGMERLCGSVPHPLGDDSLYLDDTEQESA